MQANDTHIIELAEQLHEAFRHCNAASARWQRREAELTERSAVTTRQRRLTAAQAETYRRSRKADDPQLADALSATKFWQREVTRVGIALQAEIFLSAWREEREL